VIAGSEQLVAGRRMERALSDFVNACCIYIGNEQRQLRPDNMLIALLSDAVRLAREKHDSLAAVDKYFPGALTERDSI
jgi:hypothetical protein